MKLSKNQTFLQHKALIEEALSNTAEPHRAGGQQLYRQMIICAEELDLMLDSPNGERPSPNQVAVKRDAFHAKCRALGAWMLIHAPSLKLNW